MPKCLAVWLSIALAAPVFVLADEPAKKDDKPAEKPAAAKVLAGHSNHGEAFDEGPRQAATLLSGTGKVSFPVTSKDVRVQAFFDQGVGQLHGFWYFEAERSFRQASAFDPDCPMPYWGMAMSNVNNAKRARGFIAEAVKHKQTASPRERLWIEALDEYYREPAKDAKQKLDDKAKRRQYVRRLENIIHEHNDLEAKAFLAGKIWENSSHGIEISSHQAVDTLISEVLSVEPMHPVHHYRIHLWDSEKPARALRAAALCGPASPTIAHMWHMPGHTYSKLLRYADAAWQQEASGRVDHAHMMHDGVLPDQIHNYAHNQEWLSRNLAYVGRVHDAVDLATNLAELPRHPKYNSATGKGSASFGRTRLLEVLERYELWGDLIRLAETGMIDSVDKPQDELNRVRALGTAYFLAGKPERGREQLARIDELKAKVEKETAERQAAKRNKKKSDDAGKPPPPMTPPTAATATAPATVKDSKPPPATPPKPGTSPVVKPFDQAREELLGHEQLAAGKPDAALVHYEKSGRLDKEFLSRVYLAAGKSAKAEELATAAVKAGKNQFYPLANQVDILLRLDKSSEAGKAFDELRTLGARADLELPICRRLEKLARDRGLPADWRSPPTTPDDIGQRPPLDTLGPFRWQPSPAADWQLPNSESRTVSLADYRGKPVVVIFYLGLGCVHCVEQLKAFAPLAEKYSAAGIQLVAIGTDPVDMVRSSLATGEKDKISFPLLSDQQLDVFRRYRAYDDFEHQPLHGTFLIDGQGRVRWHDISYEPFTDAAFLLKESQRLLAQGHVPAAANRPASRGTK